MKPNEFIVYMEPICRKYNSILESVTLAQSIEESGWGTSNLFKLANASFGVKATTAWKGKVYSTATKTVYNSYAEAASVGGTLFRAYNSIEESIKDHDLFLQKDRYLPVRKAKDYTEACKQLKICGYCPEDGYDTRLIKIIETYNLDKNDHKQEFPFRIRVIYDGIDGLNVRKQPNYDDKYIDHKNGPIYKGCVLTIVDEVGDFYKTKSGLYITKNKKYIEVI